MNIYARALLGAMLASNAATGQAQQQPERIEEVIVIAHPLSGEGLAQAHAVLAGAELERKLATNLGATLAAEPGVHSAQFGNAVGRPVIHGLSGPRIRIMEDRIDTLDVSVTSADHAVAIEPFVVEKIEVLKGSSTLLYGSGAIGGVVDVHTGRIPHQLPDQPVYGGIETRYDHNTNGTSNTIKLNGSVGEHFAWHLDGTWKDGDDYEIPGFAESANLRAQEAGEEQTDGDDEVRGELPGSAFDMESRAGGASYIAEWGFIGAAVSRIEADYGLPGGHHHEEAEPGPAAAEPEGNAALEMEQTRVDVELGVENPFAAFTSLNLRLGVNDYEHQEIEPSGEPATRFTNDAWEFRGELTYALPSWSGTFGIQHTDREFSAIGEEAFTPAVDSMDSGVFWVAERAFDNFHLETGLRVGHVEHDPDTGSSESFTTYSASLGAVIPFGEEWQLGVVADHSSRAPISEELYSNGPHIVTNAFEVGDPTLDNESVTGLSATLSYSGEVWNGSATVYYNQFSDFIYEQATGEIEDELPVFLFQQDDATFFGIDLQASVRFAQWEGGRAELRAMFDFVDAELDVSGNDNLPRIPPQRYGAGVTLEQGVFLASIDYMRVDAQDDVADFEFPTEAYNDLRVYLGAEIPVNFATLGLFLNGKNLTDDEQRYHTSFIKEFAPAPGRTIEIGLRLMF